MKNLKLLRKEKGLTQRNMADIMGVIERQYVRYESGENGLSVDKLIFLADFFDVSIDYLVGRSDNK